MLLRLDDDESERDDAISDNGDSAAAANTRLISVKDRRRTYSNVVNSSAASRVARSSIATCRNSK